MTEHTSTPAPVSFLILSGGVGQRSGHSEPKQFYELSGHPVIAHSIIAAIQVPDVAEIVVNAPPGFEDRTAHIMESYCAGRPWRIVPPGETRQESCRILAEAASHDRVILHEAARPFVDKAMLRQLIDCASPNAGYCHAIPFSMCHVDPETRLISSGVSRDSVFNIQLPQIFERATLTEAHRRAADQGRSYTEDAVMCLEMTGAAVLALTGHSKNLKITSQEDFIIAEHIMKKLDK